MNLHPVRGGCVGPARRGRAGAAGRGSPRLCPYAGRNVEDPSARCRWPTSRPRGGRILAVSRVVGHERRCLHDSRRRGRQRDAHVPRRQPLRRRLRAARRRLRLDRAEPARAQVPRSRAGRHRPARRQRLRAAAPRAQRRRRLEPDEPRHAAHGHQRPRHRARPRARLRPRCRRLRLQAVLLSGAARPDRRAAAPLRPAAVDRPPARRPPGGRPAVARGPAARRADGAVAEGVRAAAHAGLGADAGLHEGGAAADDLGLPRDRLDADAGLARLPAAPQARRVRRPLHRQRVGRGLPARWRRRRCWRWRAERSRGSCRLSAAAWPPAAAAEPAPDDRRDGAGGVLRGRRRAAVGSRCWRAARYASGARPRRS